MTVPSVSDFSPSLTFSLSSSLSRTHLLSLSLYRCLFVSVLPCCCLSRWFGGDQVDKRRANTTLLDIYEDTTEYNVSSRRQDDVPRLRIG